MKPPLTPKSTIPTPPTSDATDQSNQFLGVLYLALTRLIDSALTEAEPWTVAGKALFYLVKVGPLSGGPCQYLHLLFPHLKEHHSTPVITVCDYGLGETH
ncbi:hypothetical protein DSO57_1015070 [Entomophthora muscae]|uniref:Uncharacterized protein n=1 Tax=Entomophthora muscae TaxID=34485 RepID=A0ACC2SI79_9FUNG|nr:hypothetical protein DSO57_1015070 [Entomophthora muscae]